jgi:hypothetical protein
VLDDGLDFADVLDFFGVLDFFDGGDDEGPVGTDGCPCGVRLG